MGNPFEAELEIFQREAHAGLQLFYGFLSIDAVLGPHPEALNQVNRTPLWALNVPLITDAQGEYMVAAGASYDRESIERHLREMNEIFPGANRSSTD